MKVWAKVHQARRQNTYNREENHVGHVLYPHRPAELLHTQASLHLWASTSAPVQTRHLTARPTWPGGCLRGHQLSLDKTTP